MVEEGTQFTMSEKYEVVYTEEENDWWSAQITGAVKGCMVVTQGKGLPQTCERMRDALATALEDEEAAKTAIFVEVIVKKRPVSMLAFVMHQGGELAHQWRIKYLAVELGKNALASLRWNFKASQLERDKLDAQLVASDLELCRAREILLAVRASAEGSLKAEGIPNDVPSLMWANGVKDAARGILKILDLGGGFDPGVEEASDG